MSVTVFYITSFSIWFFSWWLIFKWGGIELVRDVSIWFFLLGIFFTIVGLVGMKTMLLKIPAIITPIASFFLAKSIFIEGSTYIKEEKDAYKSISSLEKELEEKRKINDLKAKIRVQDDLAKFNEKIDNEISKEKGRY